MASSDQVIIPIWLHDVYARIQSTPLQYMQGPLNEDTGSEQEAQKNLNEIMSKSNIFLNGGDVFAYLSRNLDSLLCTGVITLVVTSLRDLYWDNRSTLPQDELTQLELAMNRPLPVFKNIFEYKSLQNIGESVDVPLYQMFGTITPYSVVHVPVIHFIRALNDKIPIRVSLEYTNIILQFDYERYDFWDPVRKSLVEYIDISSFC